MSSAPYEIYLVIVSGLVELILMAANSVNMYFCVTGLDEGLKHFRSEPTSSCHLAVAYKTFFPFSSGWSDEARECSG
jgi:hypothetical protein